MKSNLAVLNSNRKTRDGYLLSIETLEGGLWQTSPYGIPTNIGHDFHRPAGWMNPFGLHIEPGLVRTVGAMRIAETEADQKLIAKARYNSINNRMQKEMASYGEHFMPLIESYLTPESRFIDVNVLACVDSKIVEKAFPLLQGLKVKDDLIPISSLTKDFKYLGHGVFGHLHSDLVIFAHSYFRRSLSRHNNFHFVFLDELVSHSKNAAVTIKIAVDWDMIGYKPSFNHSLEFEYWWGPKYDDDIKNIEVGLTVHRSNEFEKAYYGISQTEFFWKSNDNLHEFELEELREDPAPALAGDNYACRYVHSIYDKEQETFCHFDGAIRMYEGDLMLDRIGKKMTEFGRRSKYTKIFRVDGKLAVNAWKSLTTNYLQGNPLIYEYFGLEKPKGSEVLVEESKSPREKYVPYSLDKGDGIRLMVSYHDLNPITEERVATSNDKLTNEQESRDYIEYDIIEYVKALRRHGLNLTLPRNVIYGYAEDLYWNIPCIFHGNKNPQSDVTNSLSAFKSIIESLVEKEMEKVISFTMAWNDSGKEIRVSMLGHSVDWHNWLMTFSTIPTRRKDLIGWINAQYSYLNKFQVKEDKPSLFELSQFDGQLYMSRRNVEPEFEAVYRHIENQIVCALKVPQSRKDILDALEEGIITPVVSFICLSSICNVCNREYWDCEHSYMIDINTTTTPDIRRFGVFWSDKPSQSILGANE